MQANKFSVVGVDPGPEWSMLAWGEGTAVFTGRVWPTSAFRPDLIVIEWPVDQGRYRRRIGGEALRQTEAQAARWRRVMFDVGAATFCVPSGVLRRQTFGWMARQGRATPFLRAKLIAAGYGEYLLSDRAQRDGGGERTASHRIDALVAREWGLRVLAGEIDGGKYRVKALAI